MEYLREACEEIIVFILFLCQTLARGILYIWKFWKYEKAKLNHILAKEFREPRFEATCNRESSCRRNQPTGVTIFYSVFMNGERNVPEIKTP